MAITIAGAAETRQLDRGAAEWLGVRLSVSCAAFSTMAAWGALLDFTEAKIAARSVLNWALGIAASGVEGPCSRARLSRSAKLANNSLLSKEAFTRPSFSSL